MSNQSSESTSNKPQSETVTVAFIGAGNIAKAILGGYQKAKPEAVIWATDPMQEQLDQLPSSVNTTTDNLLAVSNADVVVLCVKPNMMQPICAAINSVAGNRLFISVAAGVTCTNLQSWLGDEPSIVRCMPNTPALIGQGMTGLYAAPDVSSDQKGIAEGLLKTVGKIAWFGSESELDIVTAVSGSGPAYFFLFLEAMQAAAVKMGLDADIARELSEQTAIGAALMAQQSDVDAATLRQNVTSPGGTTAAALDVFNQNGLSEIIEHALVAAEKRSKELSKS